MAVELEYEETTSGAVPVGWNLDYLGNLCVISSGTTPPRNSAERYYRNGTIHWVKTTDLTNSNITVTEELITKAALDETSLRVYPVGTVLVAMYGGFNQIGRTGLLKIPAAVNQAITAIQPRSKLLLPEYLINVLNYRINYWKTVASSSRKDPNITSYDVKKFPIIFPDKKEQQAIAIVLRDMDDLIASLDKLIVKKHDIKQATIQQLLTGKTRLPGFSRGLKPIYKQTEIGVIPGDWKLKSFRDVCRVNQGLQIAIENRLKNPTEKSKIYITVQYLNGGKEVEYIENYTLSVCCDKDDILMTRTGNTGFVVSGVSGVFHNNFFKLNYDKAIIDKDFLVYYLNMKRTQNIILTKAGTSTIPDLNHNDFYSIPIPLPTKFEQAAISTVLSDMDAEIVALEQNRDKTRALKQGMMQELLTGKTRLI